MNINANQIAIRARERINERVRAATIGTFASVIRMTPVGNPDIWKNPESAPAGYVGGRARANWQCTIGSPASGSTMSTDYGNKELEIAQSVPTQAGSVVYLTNNVPYIQKLEYDAHSQQAPNGMVRISVARFEGLLNGTG